MADAFCTFVAEAFGIDPAVGRRAALRLYSRPIINHFRYGGISAPGQYQHEDDERTPLQFAATHTSTPLCIVIE